MTRVTFDQAYSRLEKSEGGFTKDPKDKGNWTGGRVNVGILKGTKFGLSAATYPDLDIENLTPEQAKAIYYRDWWLKAGGDDFDPAIVFQLWDFAVNAGMDNAKRCLQRAARVADDGQVGEVTIAAVNAMDLNDVLFRFNGAKIRHYAKLTTFDEYGRGWMNRTADRLDDCAMDNIDLPENLKWNRFSASSPPFSRGSLPPPQSLPGLSESGSAPSVKDAPKPTQSTPPNSPPATAPTLTGSFLQILRQMLQGSKP
jgi:lysozyme family protein